MKTLAFILAGGKGTRLDLLSAKRSKPAIPFAGKYRIVDFCLSNLSNSGIYDVALLTQYLPYSLNEHIGSGKAWDFDRRDSAVALLQPHELWYSGTADAVYKNLDYIVRYKPEYVLILSGDQIYKMDYQKLIQTHQKNNADVTMAVISVDKKDVSRFGILEVDKDGYVKEFKEKPKQTNSTLANMGIYLFSTKVLVEMLEKLEKEHDDLDFGKHLFPHIIYNTDYRVSTFKFSGYWQDVGTYDSYLNTSLDLNNKILELDLYDPTWKIYTKTEYLPPVKIGQDADVSNSLISNGAIIEGKVINSVISPGVLISKNAVVKDSIIFNNCIISENVELNRVILDKNVIIGKNTKIGVNSENINNKEYPDLLYTGITVAEKGAVIPSNLEIGTNCRIHKDAVYTSDKTIKSGTTVK